MTNLVHFPTRGQGGLGQWKCVLKIHILGADEILQRLVRDSATAGLFNGKLRQGLTVRDSNF